MESCPSGLRSTPGKCVCLKRVSRVRISHSPPDLFSKKKGREFQDSRPFLILYTSIFSRQPYAPR